MPSKVQRELGKPPKQKLTYILKKTFLWESLLGVKMLSDLAFQTHNSTFLKFQMKGQSHMYCVNSVPSFQLPHTHWEVKRLIKGPCDLFDWVCSTLIESMTTLLYLMYSSTVTGMLSLKRQHVIEAEIYYAQGKSE